MAQSNQEQVKTCTECNTEKSPSEYHRDDKYKDGRKKVCKECRKKYTKKYYKDNLDRMKKCGDRNRAFVAEYLSIHPCVDCGELNPVVLEFDHVRGIKKRAISYMIPRSILSDLKKEIAKCDVRCANCHRIKTAKEQGWHDNYERIDGKSMGITRKLAMRYNQWRSKARRKACWSSQIS